MLWNSHLWLVLPGPSITNNVALFRLGERVRQKSGITMIPGGNYWYLERVYFEIICKTIQNDYSFDMCINADVTQYVIVQHTCGCEVVEGFSKHLLHSPKAIKGVLPQCVQPHHKPCRLHTLKASAS